MVYLLVTDSSTRTLANIASTIPTEFLHDNVALKDGTCQWGLSQIVDYSVLTVEWTFETVAGITPR